MEMNHCLTGIDILWRHLTADKLLYNASDLSGVMFQKPLTSSELLPCIIANLGSALTIVQVLLCSLLQNLFIHSFIQSFILRINLVQVKYTAYIQGLSLSIPGGKQQLF